MRAARGWSRAGRRRCGGTGPPRTRAIPGPSATWPGAMSTARVWTRDYGGGGPSSTGRRRSRAIPGASCAWASAVSGAGACPLDSGSRGGVVPQGGGAGGGGRASAAWASCTRAARAWSRAGRRRCGGTAPRRSRGLPRAQCNLAWCYEHGKGVARGLWRPRLRWYRRAAEQEDARGLFSVARCYDYGIGVEQDSGRGGEAGTSGRRTPAPPRPCAIWACAMSGARAWSRTMAKAVGACTGRRRRRATPPGQCNLGYLYEMRPRRGAELGGGGAVVSGRRATRACPAPSATWPGAMNTARAWSRTSSGPPTGTARRRIRRIPEGCSAWASAASTAAAWSKTGRRRSSWYRRAVDAGSVAALCNLGVCYERGEGVEQDLARGGRACTARRPSRSDAAAQCNLGYLYESGAGRGAELGGGRPLVSGGGGPGLCPRPVQSGSLLGVRPGRGQGLRQGGGPVPAGGGAAATGWPPAIWAICTRPASA